MSLSETQHITLAALVLPPFALTLLLFLSLRAGPSGQTALVATALVLSPLAIFVELAALIVTLSHWRSGKVSSLAAMASAALGILSLLGAACLVILLFGGGGGV